MAQTGEPGTRDRLDELVGDRPQRLQRALGSPVRTTRMAVVIGRLLGVAVLVCFATGLYSHFLQDPLPWMRFPTRPVQLYRWTQGLHVTTGTAMIPLLLAKLWTVYPRLFAWPPVTSWRSGLERLSIAALISSTLLQVAIGLVNTYQWYPWPFSFRAAHYGLSFVIVGALALHIAIKLPLIARYWRAGEPDQSVADHEAIPDERAEHRA